MEEIVVTARKRGPESIQDIGGSIQVLDGESLAETAAIGFADYMRDVPSLSANSSGTGQAQLSMRGISAARLNHANPNIPSTVSLYFGETPISTSGFNPKVELMYRPSDDSTLYARAAEGFRVGSVQQFINPVFCGPELAELGIDGIPTTIDGDSLWNYEAGLEQTLFGGSTTANISVYQMDWENARTQTFLACGWIAEFSLVDIVSRGVELEIYAQPTDRLSLQFAGAYNRSEVDGNLDPSAPPIASDGDAAPFTPDWKFTTGFRYEIPQAFNEFDWFLRGDVSYVGPQFNELGTSQLERVELPSNTVVNFYSGVRGRNWEVSVFIRNLTDERIVMGADTDRQRPAQLMVGWPRNAGIQLSYSFAGR